MHKLLLVDNDPIRRTLTRYAIQEVYESEVKIHELPNGYEARDDILEINPDLVFMSIDMQDMDGVDAAIEMEKRGYNNPIILWTAKQSFLYEYQKTDTIRILDRNPKSYVLLGEEPNSKMAIETLKESLGEPANYNQQSF